MALHKMVSVFDRGVDAFLRPFAVPAVGAAIRSFQDEVNNPESPMYKHARDYELYLVGEFDDTSGQFILVEREKLASGGQLQLNLGAPKEVGNVS